MGRVFHEAEERGSCDVGRRVIFSQCQGFAERERSLAGTGLGGRIAQAVEGRSGKTGAKSTGAGGGYGVSDPSFTDHVRGKRSFGG
ncbi:hypothetical protein D3C84_1015550 [compost metagenome]